MKQKNILQRKGTIQPNDPLFKMGEHNRLGSIPVHNNKDDTDKTKKPPVQVNNLVQVDSDDEIDMEQELLRTKKKIVLKNKKLSEFFSQDDVLVMRKDKSIKENEDRII